LTERVLLVPRLPWCVVLGAFVSVVPIALFADALLVPVHLPTFVALLEPAVALSCRARDGQRVSPIAIAAVVGGLIASIASMMAPATVVQMDRRCSWVYALSWIVLPILGLVGSALAAGITAIVIGIASLVRRWKARGQRSRSASCF
jgi:hypothetical protein